MRIRDELGELFSDAEFAGLYPSRGRPAWSPARLALVSIMQYAEGLTDRQAADAVRGRLDWKYLLGLELTDPGFHYSVLSEFRDRLIAGSLGTQVLDRLLEAADAKGLLKTSGRARTDSTVVLASTRKMNGLVMLGETLRAALNAAAEAEPQWLAAHAPPTWFDTYASRLEDSRLPGGKGKQDELVERIGTDGMIFLKAVYEPDAPSFLRQLATVQTLRVMWVQQYLIEDGRVRRRELKDRPPGAMRVVTPYDTEARASVKRGVYWDGYKVHLTETCEPDSPNLITHVVTTDATVQDVSVLRPIHAHLSERAWLPAAHLTDAGYATAREIVAAREQYGFQLVGPLLRSTSWQARETTGFAQADFTVDWENQQVTCPTGKTNKSWRHSVSRHGTPVIRARFSIRDCRPCPARQQCNRTEHRQGRTITLQPRAEHTALQQARNDEASEEWQKQYSHRAGVEGTISQGVRAFGLRRCRYRGLDKARLQHQLTAAAMNLHRIDAWLTGTPRALTRVSRFAALRPAG